MQLPLRGRGLPSAASLWWLQAPEDDMPCDDVREAYERWAPTYDAVANATRDLDATELRAALAGVELGKVLELGCGTGKNTRWLAERGPVIGLDFSPAMLARCRVAAPAATIRMADLTQPWPVEQAAVDTVLASLVLEHIEDLGHVASEAARVLRGSGRLRLSEFHPQRQLEGRRPRFVDEGVVVTLGAFPHDLDAYLEAFGAAGFDLAASREPRAPSDSPDRPPRLLILDFTLGAAGGAGGRTAASSSVAAGAPAGGDG